MIYELQAKDQRGNWDADNVSWDTGATQFETRAEAEQELEYWVNEGRNRNDLRVVELPSTNEL